MNFIQVVKELTYDDDIQKATFEKMAAYYERGLPNTLYQDPYELEDITNIQAFFWKQFLKTPQVTQLIESEIALIAEVKARSALNRLGGEEINTSEVAAVKALLEKSKLLQDKMTDTKTIIFHHIPVQEYENERDKTKDNKDT
jgi:hypothetical protein